MLVIANKTEDLSNETIIEMVKQANALQNEIIELRQVYPERGHAVREGIVMDSNKRAKYLSVLHMFDYLVAVDEDGFITSVSKF